MGLSLVKVAALKTVATGKDVIVVIGDGDTVSGKLVEVGTDHIKIESNEETAYLTIDVIKAIRIRK